MKIHHYIKICLLSLLLSSCIQNNQKSLFLIHIVDVSLSASSQENPAFAESIDNTCHSLANSSKFDDYYLNIPVDHDIPIVTDPEKVKNKDNLHRKCNSLKNFNFGNEKKFRKGTFICPAWLRVIEILDKEKYSNHIPVLVSQVQANELEFLSYASETECKRVLLRLAEIIDSHDGKFIHAGSTNSGGTTLNRWLWDILKNFESISFYKDDIAQKVENDVREIRQRD